MQTFVRPLWSTIGVILATVAVVVLAVAKRQPVRAQVAPSDSPADSSDPSSWAPSRAVGGAAPALAVTAGQVESGQRDRRATVAAKSPAPSYDARPFAGMSEAWERETDDAEWSLNIKTFIAAIIETVGDPSDARSVDMFSVRCRQSACRIDAEAIDIETVRKVFESSREQQAHVTYQVHSSEAGRAFEAYLGRQPGEPGDGP
jgi:hypothetical protein